MKTIIPLLLATGTAFLAGCSTPSWNASLSQAGFTAYHQPTGDATNIVDWKKYGPGSIAWIKGGHRQEEPYYWATAIIGEAGVKAAMDRTNASQISLPITNKTVKGSEFDGKGGWTLAGVNNIAGTIGVKKDSTVEVKFGNTYKASPMGQGDLLKALAAARGTMDPAARQALQKGSLACVQNVVWTDSVRYTFKVSSSHNESVTYKLTDAEIAALKAKGNKIVEGGIEINTPTFIAFTPLRDLGGAGFTASGGNPPGTSRIASAISPGRRATRPGAAPIASEARKTKASASATQPVAPANGSGDRGIAPDSRGSGTGSRATGAGGVGIGPGAQKNGSDFQKNGSVFTKNGSVVHTRIARSERLMKFVDKNRQTPR